ncbi:MAG: quinone-dependent dihydroorotate dehydrogenase [Casimicrobiaceae bacterium]
MLYSLFRPLLFSLDPEQAHRTAFSSLDAVVRAGLGRAFLPSVPADPITLMGIAFPNRVGLAAGLDKNAEHIDGLAALGFGFIECGTVTPRAQPGNPQPRLFRLVGARALVNRMGFNNAGVAQSLDNTSRAAWRGVLGLNIGKNFDTPNERAAEDYLACLRAVYVRATYVTVNIPAANTKGLRDLQADALGPFLRRLKDEQASLADRHGKYTPLVLKIAADLDPAAVEHIARLLVAHRVDGVVATNTTTSREGVGGVKGASESGGLSGEPLRVRATEVVHQLSRNLDGALPIIGVGGIASGNDALEKIDAGASLVQLYTGLIYRGPDLVAECGRALAGRRAAGRRQS